MEFSVGGNPTNPADIGYIPCYGIVDIGGGVQRFAYVYPRRTDWQRQGLVYNVGAPTSLITGPWINSMHWTEGIGQDGFGAGFDAVTNYLLLDNAAPGYFIRLEVDN